MKKDFIIDPKLIMIFDLLLSKLIQHNTNDRVQLEETDHRIQQLQKFQYEYQAMNEVIQESMKSNIIDIK